MILHPVIQQLVMMKKPEEVCYHHYHFFNDVNKCSRIFYFFFFVAEIGETEGSAATSVRQAFKTLVISYLLQRLLQF